jgi:hypothetical protein
MKGQDNPPAPTKTRTKRAKLPHNAMHVLPNQSKNPKLGDAVMIGVGNDEVTGLIIFHSATVVQIAPARHGDQKYRFKWQIPAGLENNQQARVGWTNEHQRCAPNRTSKCDDRVATHTTFDFVRNIDLKELNKKELLKKLYQDLRAAALTTTTAPPTKEAAPLATTEGQGEVEEGEEKEIETEEEKSSVICSVCNLQIESKDETFQFLPCCFSQFTFHAKCNIESFLLKHRNAKKVYDANDVKKRNEGRKVILCPMCDCEMPQTPLEKHECAIQMSLKVSNSCFASVVGS